MTTVTKARQTVEVLPVFLTNERVKQSEVDSVKLPPRARRATRTEQALFYRNSAEHRDDLCKNGAAWVEEIGSDLKGTLKILEDGAFKSISEKEWRGLQPNERAWGYPGRGRVAVGGYYWAGGLCVLGVIVPGPARVAYVIEPQAGREAAAPQQRNTPKMDVNSSQRHSGTSQDKKRNSEDARTT